MKNTSAIRRTVAALAIGGAAAAAAAPAANAAPASTWDALAQCESGGNWATNTGNGFYGGLQFTQQSWNGVGMSGSPMNASREQQIEAAERLLAQQGWGAWPACSSKLGLSGNATPSYTDPGAAQQEVAPQAQAQQSYSEPVQEAAPAAPAPTTQAPAQEAPAAPVQEAAPAAQAPAATAAGIYTVQSGDTLSGIAAQLGVAGGYQAIAAANTDVVYNVDLIFPGQVLNIPA
ncbi:transglycosylase family protein [Rothia dentocariosa]|uniref:transglycosylase family protein n=1 Tax=Rothia dentocariosa TaxID=2047 RepID=UPI00178CDAB9|nr:transglycosylase family protein [Rothia dentocariosa]